MATWVSTGMEVEDRQAMAADSEQNRAGGRRERQEALGKCSQIAFIPWVSPGF